MQTEIKISAEAKGIVVIDIEGTIGVAENEQFDQARSSVSTYGAMCQRLEAIAQIKAPKVIVNIRSTGGNVGEAILIYEALTALQAHITTRCFGYTASAATIIAQAADLGCRQISTNALYLIHNASVVAEGNANEIGATVDLLDKTDQRIASIYASRSGKSAQSYIQIMGRNNGNGQWLSPAEAIEAGLADCLCQSAQQGGATNQINEDMQISKRFKTILEVLGITNREQTPQIDHQQMECIEQELVARAQNIEALQDKVVELQATNERLRAEATATKPKEDPSASEQRPSINQQAYLQDARSFK